MSKKWILIAASGGVAVVAAVFFFAGVSLSFNAWSHQPSMAADAGEAFAAAAFVEGDAGRAFTLLTPAPAEEVSVDQLAEILAQLHRDGRPDSVDAIEYEPLPGYRGMGIYIEGESAERVFYYRLLMEGTSLAGYTISGFWRGSGPYPNPEDRKPLR
jgi:hypothetical protein